MLLLLLGHSLSWRWSLCSCCGCCLGHGWQQCMLLLLAKQSHAHTSGSGRRVGTASTTRVARDAAAQEAALWPHVDIATRLLLKRCMRLLGGASVESGQ